MSYPYGYTDEFRRQRELEQAQREAEKQELKRQNERLRKERLSKLDAKKKAEERERQAAIDRELEPQKLRAKRQWLYDHPAQTEADFEKRAWPLLRENLVEDRQQSQIENEIAAQRRKRGMSI